MARRVPDEVIEWVSTRIAEGAYKGVIKREIAEIMGCTFSPWDYEAIFKRARALVRHVASTDIDEFIQQQVIVYASIIADHEASNKDKLKAMEQRENLLGMGARFGTVNPRQKVVDMRKALDELDAQESVSGADASDGGGDV